MTRRPWPGAVQVALGAAFVVWGLTLSECGRDMCLRNLWLVTTGIVWTLVLPLTLAAWHRGNLMAWVSAVIWLPLGWLASFVLWMVFPSLSY